MSEMPPEGEGGGAGGFLTKKYMGLPGYVWLIGVAVLAYLYFRTKSGSGTSGSNSTAATTPSNANSGTSTTGNTTFGPPTTNLTINSQYAQTSSSTAGVPAPRHATPNPQPTPLPKPPTKKAVTTVKTPAKAAPIVTVTKWTATNTPWNSTLWGIANHYNTTVANLLKLNPQIKNANLVYPGEKVKV